MSSKFILIPSLALTVLATTATQSFAGSDTISVQPNRERYQTSEYKTTTRYCEPKTTCRKVVEVEQEQPVYRKVIRLSECQPKPVCRKVVEVEEVEYRKPVCKKVVEVECRPKKIVYVEPQRECRKVVEVVEYKRPVYEKVVEVEYVQKPVYHKVIEVEQCAPRTISRRVVEVECKPQHRVYERDGEECRSRSYASYSRN